MFFKCIKFVTLRVFFSQPLDARPPYFDRWIKQMKLQHTPLHLTRSSPFLALASIRPPIGPDRRRFDVLTWPLHPPSLQHALQLTVGTPSFSPSPSLSRPLSLSNPLPLSLIPSPSRSFLLAVSPTLSLSLSSRPPLLLDSPHLPPSVSLSLSLEISLPPSLFPSRSTPISLSTRPSLHFSIMDLSICAYVVVEMRTCEGIVAEAVAARSSIVFELRETPAPKVEMLRLTISFLQEQRPVERKNRQPRPLRNMLISVKPQAKKAKIDASNPEKPLDMAEPTNGNAEKSQRAADSSLSGLVSYSDESEEDES
ncbi:hypothetical protein ACLOJK_026719 [Asimina triloba]